MSVGWLVRLLYKKRIIFLTYVHTHTHVTNQGLKMVRIKIIKKKNEILRVITIIDQRLLGGYPAIF